MRDMILRKIEIDNRLYYYNFTKKVIDSYKLGDNNCCYCIYWDSLIRHGDDDQDYTSTKKLIQKMLRVFRFRVGKLDCV